MEEERTEEGVGGRPEDARKSANGKKKREKEKRYFFSYFRRRIR